GNADRRRDRARLHDVHDAVAAEHPLDVLRSAKLVLERQSQTMQLGDGVVAQSSYVIITVPRFPRAIEDDALAVDLARNQPVRQSVGEVDEYVPFVGRRDYQARLARVHLALNDDAHPRRGRAARASVE